MLFFSAAFLFQVSETVSIVPNNRAAKKARIKGNEWKLSIWSVIFLLLAATCFAPLPKNLGPSDSIYTHGSDGFPNLAIQNRLVGSAALNKALRTAGNLSHVVHSAKISANDLTTRNFLPGTIELDKARLPSTQFLVSKIKVRAPPFRFSVRAL